MSQEAPIEAFRNLRLDQGPEDQTGFKFQNIGLCVGSKAVLKGLSKKTVHMI